MSMFSAADVSSMNFHFVLCFVDMAFCCGIGSSHSIPSLLSSCVVLPPCPPPCCVPLPCCIICAIIDSTERWIVLSTGLSKNGRYVSISATTLLLCRSVENVSAYEGDAALVETATVPSVAVCLGATCSLVYVPGSSKRTSTTARSDGESRME